MWIWVVAFVISWTVAACLLAVVIGGVARERDADV